MFTSSIFLCGLLVTWATPVWLISVGAAFGLLVLAAIFGVLYLVSRPTADWMFASVREGVLLPIFYLVCALSAFAVLGTVLVPGLPYQARVGFRLTVVGRGQPRARDRRASVNSQSSTQRDQCAAGGTQRVYARCRRAGEH